MTASVRQFPCAACGADVTWDPSSETHRCSNCGATVVPPAFGQVLELDFEKWSRTTGSEANVELQERLVVKCAGCGAESTFGDNVTAGHCAFCGAAITAQRESRRMIKPGSVLPFRVTHEQAVAFFQKWVKTRWFAPNAFTRLARPDSGRLRGVYLPFWTYDAHATTDYTGQRGDDYTTTEQYTTQENGRTVTKTRTVTHTRWRSASGTVENDFDDVLVSASGSVPTDIVAKLEPWDLEALTPYADEYLAGFESESYAVDLNAGFERAQEAMKSGIESTVRSDIGGDHQRISSLDSAYRDVTFKHLLLPLWLCSYRFREKIFRVVINARTGEVQGQRPWSWIKITLLVVLIAAVVAGTAFVVNTMQRRPSGVLGHVPGIELSDNSIPGM